MRKGSEKLAHTYSIVAMDEKTGEIGVAVQSHWFSVGSVVSWGEAGVGVVATQAMVNPAFGPKGIEMLKAGMRPAEIVKLLTKEDEGREMRQLAVLNANGQVATYTGHRCIAEAGHAVGKGYSCQANMMLKDTVWTAMAKAFESSTAPLPERLLAALEAAQVEGGDIRGKQSASMLVFKGVASEKPWDDKLVDLRVDDSPRPLVELKRILTIHRAYEKMNQGDVEMEKGDMRAAMDCYSVAEKMFPENLEMRFWQGVTLANNGKMKEASAVLAPVFKKDMNWRTLMERLPKAGLLKVDPKELGTRRGKG
ncbi:MAG: DUF1028 domain-containing protein [Methanomassiliicoccales archaeon]|nr:DUF1028 domain-containing protein [Methanomassiliicoccales archaeon]